MLEKKKVNSESENFARLSPRSKSERVTMFRLPPKGLSLSACGMANGIALLSANTFRPRVSNLRHM